MNSAKVQATTSWLNVFLLFGAGASAAGLVGKVPVALPILRDELSLSLWAAGLVISIFSLIAAGFGAVFGAIADRYGAKHAAVSGLLLAAAASTMGAFADSSTLLLSTRVFEGIGFFLASSSIPALMLSLSRTEDRQKAMGLWGAFMPAGTAVMMIFGGSIVLFVGWEGLWLITAGVLFVAALVVWLSSGGSASAPNTHKRFTPIGTYRILLLPGPLLMALVFVSYSAQFLAVTAFVPLILVEESDWALAAAGLAGGLVIGVNVVGNVLAGILLDRGGRRQAILIAGALGMAIGAAVLLAVPVPVLWKLAGGAIFTIAGGLIPGALFAGTSVHAPASTEISTLNGLLLQGAAVGQLVGPPVAVTFAQATGAWSGVLWFTLPAALLTVVLAVMLGALEKRMEQS